MTLALSRPLKGTVAAAAFVLCLGVANAQEKDPNAVVAKVGDVTITEADIALAARDYAQQLQQVPPTQWRGVLTDVLVEMTLFANEAEKEGLDKTEEFKRAMNLERLRALQNAYFQKNIQGTITEAELKDAYGKKFENFAGSEEVSARHILVDSEEEANGIIAQLDKGANFEELAKEKSTGPSGPNGGSLGYFGKGQMVPEFEKAAFGLKPGSYTKEPVKTQFGYHIIKSEDKRQQPAPAFEQVEGQLTQEIMAQKFKENIEKLKENTKVEVFSANAEGDKAAVESK
ncbi:peptidylprolyl isomerase [Flexibacterium corallicola]|uniref:peptidylprolyl isomerase n=1 Tax=Flexibacterium corallicola TaxID=3037259 RepID=UPI00286ED9A7|nr:peptidylprolyl isomerase [Pseudovibrio sp. M1P-2-3]